MDNKNDSLFNEENINEITDNDFPASVTDGEAEDPIIKEAIEQADNNDSSDVTEDAIYSESDSQTPASDDSDIEASPDEECYEPCDENTTEKSTDTDNNDNKSDVKRNANRPKTFDSIFDFLELVIFTLVCVIVFTTFFFRHSVVDGQSMMNTLQHNDVVIISDLMYKPQKGDIVVCEDYSTELKVPIIKRVIATEGDVIRVSRTAIYVNGELLDEPYVYIDYTGYNYSVIPSHALLQNPTLVLSSNYYELTVPSGEIFVMGDHRNDSADSRLLGTIREDAVIGKALIRIYPFDKFGKID